MTGVSSSSKSRLTDMILVPSGALHGSIPISFPIAKELGVPVLGKMPIDTAIAEAVEAEKFYEVTNPYLKEIDL